MKFYLISDNNDTLVGMRLAGIPGVIVHKEEEVRKTIADAMDKDDIAIILITEGLVKLCREFIYELKLNKSRPLIVEIPDRHGGGRSKDSITRYIREAIGLKL